MSPRAALESPVALFYLALTPGLLLVAGLLLVGFRQKMPQAWQAYRGWLIMVPIIALALFLGRESTIVFFTVVALLGFREFALATGLQADRPMTLGVHLGILAMATVTLLRWYDLFMVLPVFVIVLLLAIPIARDRVVGQLQSITLAVFGLVYFGWLFGHIGWLANSEHVYAYLPYLLFAVELNDVAAYVCGKLLGRHLLRSTISPKKTWEGALGALAVSLALPWALWFTFPHLTWVDLLACGLIVGIGGQLGDLVISVFKRDLGIKDMGAAIPGHGGILDRIDSLIYVAPLYFHYLRWRHALDST